MGSYDFVNRLTHDERILRGADADGRVHAQMPGTAGTVNDPIETLAHVMLIHAVPEHIRSDHGPEFVGDG